MNKNLITILLLISVLSHNLPAYSQPSCSPSDAGLAPELTSRLDSLMLRYVNQKKLPGMITLVSRHGKLVYKGIFGCIDGERAMPADAIFRIASMTKPVTSAAAMILYDEGRFQLDDPVAMYIPEFGDMNVFASVDSGRIKTIKANSPVTIRQLLMHTSGLAHGGDDSPVDSLYRESNLSDGNLQDMIPKITSLPLLYQPGTHWNYSRSTDVLARLVEVLSGKPFDEFLEERIFKPLQMNSTGFYVPPQWLDRVATVYSLDDSARLMLLFHPDTANVATKVTFMSGNGGLVSTATDYLIFAQMLLNKGQYNGVRLLKSSTVGLMTSNQITTEQMPSEGFLGDLLAGMGFGLGFAVVKESNPPFTGSAGSYWWSGSANTYFLVDPDKDLVLIFMTQLLPNFCYPVCKELREIVYQSILK